MLKYIKCEALDGIFPNVEIILRMYLSTAVSNCTGEKSFSVLKRVKNYMRSSMKDDRLNALSHLSIESDLLKTLNLDEIINDFGISKSREKSFSNKYYIIIKYNINCINNMYILPYIIYI